MWAPLGNRTHGAALTHSSNHERHCAGADRRRHQLLQETLAEGGSREERELHLRFLLSPVRIVEHLGAVNSGRVGGIVLGSNRLEGPKGSRKAVATGHEETVSCGLVLRSVGYRSLPIMGIPFDTSSNTVPHGAGRVLSQGGGGTCLSHCTTVSLRCSNGAYPSRIAHSCCTAVLKPYFG